LKFDAWRDFKKGHTGLGGSLVGSKCNYIFE